jgi:CDP-paratose 2-epimerase
VLAGAGQFGTPDQGIFSYWINAHLHRRPLRYIGFEGTGMQVRDALHPNDLAALLCAEMATGRANGQRVYNVGGGPENAVSLAELTAWCDSRFGRHTPQPDPRPRTYDVPWVILDSGDADRDFHWRINAPIENILRDIAVHAELNPDWLERSGL